MVTTNFISEFPYPCAAWHPRGYLPHFEGCEITQFVTFRLADSLPQNVLRQLQQERMPDFQRTERIQKYLDAGYGSCVLQQPAVAEIVQNTLLHFDGVRYYLHEWSIMPNHVHALLTLIGIFSIKMVLGSWKGFSANRVNRLLGTSGKLWQVESFDRFVRSRRHFDWVANYIRQNAVDAGLVTAPELWPFCSARYGGVGTIDLAAGHG